jgi:outer membrane receptor protein involved in Fe transport
MRYALWNASLHIIASHASCPASDFHSGIGGLMSSRLVAQLLHGASALSILSFAVVSPAAAQEAAASGAVASGSGASSNVIVLDTVTVTGEKVTRDLKDTAASVAIKTAKEIEKEKTGNATVTEVVSDVPNVIYTETVGIPVIRGLDGQGPNTGAGAFFSGTVPRATINVDGHYLNYNESYFGATSVWDLDSIEVFRGPQTTSQGANAIAGAIIVNTKDPTFTREGAYQAEIGNYNQKRASFMLSGPLVENELAGRIAIDYSGRDTFIDYISSAYSGEGTDLEFKALNARGKLLWQPSEIPGFEAKLTYSLNKTNRPTQESAYLPFEDLNSYAATMPTWKQDTHTGILDISYDFGNGYKFYNQTQYSDSSVHRKMPRAGIGAADVEQTNFSNEARVTFGEQEDVISGVAGIYYAHVSTDEKLDLPGRFPGAGNGYSTFDDTKDNLGLFSEVNWKFAEQWTVTGGLRYQHDQIKRHGLSTYAAGAADFDKSFSALLPKLSITYAATPDWNIGALVSRGYNPGGVTLDFGAASPAWRDFKEESIWNYELFTRASLLDNRLVVNGNLFYMDFKNAQYNIPAEIAPNVDSSYTINADKAHSYGVEIGADYLLLDNLTIKGSAGILRTKIDEISLNTQTSYVGNEFAKSPGYMLSLGVSWDATEKLNISGQVRHTDGYYSNIANDPAYAVGSYTVADARVSYQFTDAFQVYGYVKNIFDERAPTYMQANRGIGGLEAAMTPPRMFGVGVRGSF